MSALVTHPMSLVAVFAFVILLVLAGQGQGLLDYFTSTLSVIFWELVVAIPLLAFVFIPLCLVTTAIVVVIILPILASVVVLVFITVSVDSPIFHQILNFVVRCSSLFIQDVAQLVARVASIMASIHISKLIAKLRHMLKIEPTPINPPTTPIPVLSGEPRRFRKRRPIKYSGAKPTLPLDPRNDASTRLAARIARIQSGSWKVEALKKASISVQDSEPTVTATTAPTQDNQEASLDTLPSVASTHLTLAEGDLPIAQVNFQSDTITDAHDRDPELVITPASPPLPPALPPHTTPGVEIGVSVTELERPLSPIERVVAVEQQTLSLNSIDDIQANSYTNLTELLVLDSPAPSIIEHSSPLPQLISEPVNSIVTGLVVDQDIIETTASIAAENNIAQYTVNDTHVFASEQHFEVAPTFVPQGDELNHSKLMSTETTTSSVAMEPYVNSTQPDQSPPAYDLPNQPSLVGLILDDILRAEMELLATPAYQDSFTETEPFDGHVDAPPSQGMSAPNTIDQGSQFGYMQNMSGVATFTSDLGLTFAPNAVENHGMPGSDPMQADHDAPFPSDAELFELAAAMIPEGMDWFHGTLSSGTFRSFIEDTPAPLLSGQELLELDNALQLAAASFVPQTPNDPLTTTNTHLNPEYSTPFPTDDELLELAGAAMFEDMTGTPNTNAFLDFDLNFTDTDMLFLDSSQMELLEQATQSVMASLTNQAPNPSGALNLSEPSSFNTTDPFNYAQHTDSNELARLWDELGASLKDWAGQVPDAMDFSEDDMMRILMEFDAVDTTCSPSHMVLNTTPALISTPASTFTPLNPAPAAQPARKIKRLPLRRTAIENHARMMNQCA
ncbi:unnamed protein product [Rhizoctonia solani]|uniref:Uncharacterized protein n=1 Tax=Rhizoctonia solani TaxID=456999 RepID=A0A8H3D9Y2_9AGAM|nr:unnamed protein product [Rhizoctonia solani]